MGSGMTGGGLINKQKGHTRRSIIVLPREFKVFRRDQAASLPSSPSSHDGPGNPQMEGLPAAALKDCRSAGMRADNASGPVGDRRVRAGGQCDF